MQRTWKLGILTTAVAALCGATGCFVAADAINPGIFSAFGLDPGSITRPPGTVIVTLNNTTDFDAIFFTGYSNEAGATTTTIGVDDEVAGNTTLNRVFACPVTLLRPGQFGLADANAAVAVFANNAPVTVAYAGAPLRTGDFNCGDLVEVRLERVGAGVDAAAFRLVVQVLPGR